MTTPRFILRLHRNDRGHIGVMFLFLAFILVALLFMIMHMGRYAETRMVPQFAADTAAYSAAAWNARTVNMIAATNMLILRTASALTVAEAAQLSAYQVFKRLKKEEAATLAAIAAATASGQLYLLPPLEALLLAIRAELVEVGILEGRIARGVAKIPSFQLTVKSLYGAQQRMVSITPQRIEEQRSKLARQYDCDIRLSRLYTTGRRPHGRIFPFVEPGNAITLSQLLSARVSMDSKSLDRQFRLMLLGLGRKTFQANLKKFYGLNVATTGHHVLEYQSSPLEPGTTNDRRQRYRTVIAVAATKPVWRPRIWWPQLFDKRVPDFAAYATAETFNGYDYGPTASVPRTPWRLWTTQGWYWRARLSQAQAMRLMISESNVDPNMRGLLQRAKIRFVNGHDISPVNLH